MDVRDRMLDGPYLVGQFGLEAWRVGTPPTAYDCQLQISVGRAA